MIIPSIDLQGGQTVQLIGGKEKALDAGDPRPLLRQFGVVGEVAVIDLDAALGQGDQTALIEELVRQGPCRVGGGIRSIEKARQWLDAGACKIILGTAARAELLQELPRARLIAALDADSGEVVVEGWTKKTGLTVPHRMAELRELVGGFLVTFVEREGRLGGIDIEQVKRLKEAAGHARLTVAGGVTTAQEVAELDRLGVDAQVGMALYTGRLTLAQCLAATLSSDRPDGLWPTVVVNESEVALGLCWSNAESLQAAITRQQGVYHSRKRGLWVKGETSGHTQELLRISLDCDRDALRFTVRQRGSFCHTGSHTCWGEPSNYGSLIHALAARMAEAPAGSYTTRLLNDPDLLRAKLCEEAGELAAAETPDHVAAEAADVLYFTAVAMVRAGVQLEEVERVLAQRALKVTRRPGNAKEKAT
ncbi:MAG TPA: phosphoribosyl-ATP diphosphatase [Candidatus Xenobia bacterium]